MVKRNSIAAQTRNNWLIDATLFVGALIASITGIYFLILPVGGYQGGRNPMYGITIFFERHTWNDLHTWFGVLMIVTAMVHIVIHRRWFLSMARRTAQEILHRQIRLNNRSRLNLLINVAVGLGFVASATSGIYLLFVPGGRNVSTDPQFIFTRSTWDLIHSWSGIVMMGAAVIHFSIHWKWVTKVTLKVFQPLRLVSPQGQFTKNLNT